MQILGSSSCRGYRDKFKACLQWLVLCFLRNRQLENWGRDEREERRHNWSSLARKFRVPAPSSEGEMVGREEEADRLIPSCPAFCSGSQQCVVGARGEKPSQLVHWEKAGDSVPWMSQHYGEAAWGVGAGMARHSSGYSGMPQSSGVYQGFAVSMWLM